MSEVNDQFFQRLDAATRAPTTDRDVWRFKPSSIMLIPYYFFLQVHDMAKSAVKVIFNPAAGMDATILKADDVALEAWLIAHHPSIIAGVEPAIC